jgi:hypothetical protein
MSDHQLVAWGAAVGAPEPEDSSKTIAQRYAELRAKFVTEEEPASEAPTIWVETTHLTAFQANGSLAKTEQSLRLLRTAALARIKDRREQVGRALARAGREHEAVRAALAQRAEARRVALEASHKAVVDLEAAFETALQMQAEMTQLLPAASVEGLSAKVGQMFAAMKGESDLRKLDAAIRFAEVIYDLTQQWPRIQKNVYALADFQDQLQQAQKTVEAAGFDPAPESAVRLGFLEAGALMAQTTGFAFWEREATGIEAELKKARVHLAEQQALAEAETAGDAEVTVEADRVFNDTQARLQDELTAFEARAEFDTIRTILSAADQLATVETRAEFKPLLKILAPYQAVFSQELRQAEERLRDKERAAAEAEQAEREAKRAREKDLFGIALERKDWLLAGYCRVPGEVVLTCWPNCRDQGGERQAWPMVVIWRKASPDRWAMAETHRLREGRWDVSTTRDFEPVPFEKIGAYKDRSNLFRATIPLPEAIAGTVEASGAHTAFREAFRTAVEEKREARPPKKAAKPSRRERNLRKQDLYAQVDEG